MLYRNAEPMDTTTRDDRQDVLSSLSALSSQCRPTL